MKFGSATFWRFLRYARPYWPYILGSVVTGVLKFSLALLIPLSLGYVIDYVILAEIPDDEKMTRLFQVVGVLLVVFIGRIPISYYRSYWAELAGNRTIFDIRNALYAHVQRLSLSYHANQRTGTTTSRLTNDINTAQGILDRGVMSVMVVDAPTLNWSLWVSPAWLTRTRKRPLVAPDGTTRTSRVGVADRTTTGRLPRVTRLSAMRGAKFSPSSVTSVPGPPLVGFIRLITGVGRLAVTRK